MKKGCLDCKLQEDEIQRYLAEIGNLRAERDGFKNTAVVLASAMAAVETTISQFRRVLTVLGAVGKEERP